MAEGKGVQIIIFPEMSITGYTCGDLFGQQLLLEEAEMGLMQILNNTRQLDIISIVGMPVVVNSTVINAAVVDSPKPQDENTYPAIQRADCWLMREQR